MLGPHPRIVFFGSGAFAIPSFEALVNGEHDVVALVTQPDREKGRGRATAPPALKPVAEGRGVPLLQPRRIKEPSALDAVKALAPELCIVVAYGQILPRSILELPPHGCINVHGSLLPRYRGAAPIQWAVTNGESETGVTTMLLDEGMDTGPLLLRRETPIGSDETAGELEPRLAALGAALLLETLEGLRQGTLRPTPQDASAATLAPILRKQDGHVDWSSDAAALGRRVRGFSPWPGTFTAWSGATLKLLRAMPAEGFTQASPGEVAWVDRSGVTVACGGGTLLQLLEVQPESRKAMSAAAWATGARLAPGARLG
jgi:methionyl-tRNA formyltransferase